MNFDKNLVRIWVKFGKNLVPGNQWVEKWHFWTFFGELKMFFQSLLPLGIQNITAIDTEKWLFWAKIGPKTAESVFLIKKGICYTTRPRPPDVETTGCRKRVFAPSEVPYIRLWIIAYTARPATDLMPVLWVMFLRWELTVWTEMLSLSAISLLLRPFATSTRTSVSRSLSS